MTSNTRRRQTIGILLAAIVAAVLVLVLAPDARGVPAGGEGVPQGEDTATGEMSREEAFKKLEEAQADLARATEDTGPPDFRIDHDPEGNPYVAGELMVAYKEGASSSAVASINQEADARVDNNIPEVDSAVLSFPEVKNERAQAAREAALERIRQKLEKEPGVAAADYNYVTMLPDEPDESETGSPDDLGAPSADPDESVQQGFGTEATSSGEVRFTPNDPLLSAQWGLQNINAPQAWDTATGANTFLAVLDSGVQENHPDLSSKMATGSWDWVNNDSTAEDNDGHGTHVAGIAAAATHNNRGIAGTAPNALIVNYKVCDITNQGTLCFVDSWTRALTFAADTGVIRAVNMSFGSPDVLAAQRAVDYAVARNVVPVVAAGNSGLQQDLPPGKYANAVNVSSINANYTKSDYSTFGATVDVAAPGGEGPRPSLGGGCGTAQDDILSTYPTYIVASGFRHLCGTSMAAPFVTGVAALLASQGLNSAQIDARLKATAVDLGPAGADVFYGSGLVNAYRAVNNITGGGSTCTGNTYPFITKLRPAHGSTISDRTPRIRATVTDRQHVLSKGNIKLYVDNRRKLAFRYSGGSGRLIYQSGKLGPGWHKAKVFVTDPCGAWRYKIWRFKIER